MLRLFGCSQYNHKSPYKWEKEAEKRIREMAAQEGLDLWLLASKRKRKGYKLKNTSGF